jgi:hypothetical protein
VVEEKVRSSTLVDHRTLPVELTRETKTSYPLSEKYERNWSPFGAGASLVWTSSSAVVTNAFGVAGSDEY